MSARRADGHGPAAPAAVGLLGGESLVLDEADAAFLGLVGVTADGFGQPLGALVVDEAGERLFEGASQAFTTGLSTVVAGLPGPRGPVDVVGTPRRDADNTVVGVLVLAFDAVTELASVPDRLEPSADDDHETPASHDLLDDAFVARLKAAVLPDRLPALPTVDLGAAHLSADGVGAVGNDWFDAVVRDDGHVVLVVGDVAGWGVPGVVASCELRAVIHERLCSGADLVATLKAADAHLRCGGVARSATACLVEVDLEGGALQYVTAGHPPPVVWSATGGARFLPATSGTPIGTIQQWPVRHHRLEIDETVVVCSDGLLERPRREAAAGTVEVVAAVDEIMRASLDDDHDDQPVPLVDVLSRTLISSLTARTGHSDDVTVLAAQRRSRVRDLVLALPADREAGALVRSRVGEWLQALHPCGFDLAAIEHVLDELVRNVVQHAYPEGADGTPGEVRVTASWAARGGLTVTVADDGRWREAAGPTGHGLALVAELARSVEVRAEPFGTAVVVDVDLNRSTQLVEPAATSAVGPGSPLRVHWSAEDHTVRVVGAVDVDAAERLRVLLVRGTVGGTRPTTLDLSHVTHLGAAAVKVLFDLAHATRGADVTLVAPPGSAAQQVLDRVGLAHRS